MLEMKELRQCIAELATDYQFRRMELFGSYAQGKQKPGSDIDLLVSFQEPTVSLLTLSSLKQELEDRLGVSVDLLHAPLPQDAMILPREVVVLYE